MPSTSPETSPKRTSASKSGVNVSRPTRPNPGEASVSTEHWSNDNDTFEHAEDEVALNLVLLKLPSPRVFLEIPVRYAAQGGWTRVYPVSIPITNVSLEHTHDERPPTEEQTSLANLVAQKTGPFNIRAKVFSTLTPWLNKLSLSTIVESKNFSECVQFLNQLESMLGSLPITEDWLFVFLEAVERGRISAQTEPSHIRRFLSL